jgi:hypothetical protein
MPIRKVRLSTTEMAKYLACARDLRGAGLISETPSEWRGNRGPLDIQVAPPPDSVVCVLPNGHVSYAIWVRLLSRSVVTLQDCQITTRWDDQVILTPFDEQEQSIDSGGQLYHQSNVLNRRLGYGLRVGSNVVEGWILASGLRPMPAGYRDFFVVPCELTFWDLFGREFSVDVKLSVLCAPQRCKPCVSRGSGLYGPENQPYELSVVEASRLRYLELVRQEKEAEQQRADGRADAGIIGKRDGAESEEQQKELMKKLTDYLAILAKADLDTALEE